ncbi:DUF7683 domain-containing protein [Amycolatopsis samaneae]|uniref:DUF7683 domain-containing protein n=1 Tax=Amycolatopsis samaneae TaxID=664691 RepID=A0ABW5GBU5_9PSEU
MAWQVEAFRRSDELLEWEVALIDVSRDELKKELGLSDISIPASYPLTARQVVSALRLASSDSVVEARLDEGKFEFFLSEYAG